MGAVAELRPLKPARIRRGGRVSHEGSMGVRLSPSPIHYIVVIVQKDHPCVAQVIPATSVNAYMFRREGRVQGEEENHDIASVSQSLGRSGRGRLAGTESNVAACY